MTIDRVMEEENHAGMITQGLHFGAPEMNIQT